MSSCLGPKQVELSRAARCEDHLLPLADFYWQIKMLKNACSITARLFTKIDSAQSHCQVGNYGLAFKTFVNWLDGMQAPTLIQVPDAVLPPIGAAAGRLRGRDAQEPQVEG